MEPFIKDGSIGLLNTPKNGFRIDETVQFWAMDNGCFTETYPGDEKFLNLLEKYSPHASRCLFVAAPDIVGDAAGTLLRSAGMFSRIRSAGYSPALVGQDGMEGMELPWDDFDWVFIGGTTEWKLNGAVALIRQAQERGKKVHVGRVNGGKRFKMFRSLDCDTADGTFLAFGPEKNMPKLLSWINAPHEQTLPM